VPEIVDDTTAAPAPVAIGPPAALGDPSGRRAIDMITRPITDPIVRQARAVEKALARHTATRVLAAIPRTTGFALRTIGERGGESTSGLPTTHLTPRLLGYVALDEAIVTAAMRPDRFPRRVDYERVSAELTDARALYAARGWVDDPSSYHRTPPPVAWRDVTWSKGWANGLGYEAIAFPSGFEPRPEEPGAARWDAFEANRTAGAWVLRHHDDRPRPWLVCLHGFGMGPAYMAFTAFHAAHLHRTLGMNLVGPTLPLHGHRRSGAFSGDNLLSYDLMNSVHGLTQAIWDIRRLVSWIREHEPAPTAIGAFGVSLGGYTTALLAAIEPGLDLALAGIPVSDFPALFEAQSPAVIRSRSLEHGILGGPAAEVHRVVSPLAMEPLVARERRAIFAGMGDRLAPPAQAHALWRHWGEPRMRWYPGNHVGYVWSSKVRSFIDDVVVDAGFGTDVGRVAS
jgi:hypothetical protein